LTIKTTAYTVAVMANMGQKGLIKIEDRPMIEYVLEAIPEDVDDIVITCVDDVVDEYHEVGEPYGARMVTMPPETADIRSQLEPVFQASRGEGLLILRCDTPFVTRGLTTFLLEIITRFSAGIPRPHIDRPEYTPASYRVKPFLEAMRESPSIPMGEILKKVRNILYISAESLRLFDPKLRFFQRVNSSGDAAKAAGILRSLREDRG